MRYVPSLPPPTLTGIGTREVRGVMRTRPIRPTRILSHPEAGVDIGPPHGPRPEAVPVPAVEHRGIHPEERRLVCRRINHRPALLDLRFGLDRRRHKLRGTDTTEHIDEEV